MYQIYGKIDCSNCDKAKLTLDEWRYEYETKLVDIHFTREDLYQIAPRSHRSFPMITKNGEYLGGIKELLIDLEKGGEL